MLEAGDQIEFGRLRFTVTGGARAARLRPRRQPASPTSSRPAPSRGRRASAVGRRGAVDAQRAVRGGRPQDHVVRRERRRPRLRQGARRDRGGLRQHPRRAVRVHRLQRLRRRRRRILTPAARLGLPRRASPARSPSSGAARTALEVREEALPLDVLREADEVFITSSTKDVLADPRRRRPGPRARPGDRAGRRGVRAAVHRADGPVTERGRPSRSRRGSPPPSRRTTTGSGAARSAPTRTPTGSTSGSSGSSGAIVTIGGLVAGAAARTRLAHRLRRHRDPGLRVRAGPAAARPGARRGSRTGTTGWHPKPLWFKGLVGLVTLALVLAIFYGLFLLSGVPGFIPDFAEDRIKDLPGL